MKTVMNKVVLSGYAGADAVVKSFSDNQKLARVNIAVNEHITTKKGEDIKKTHWFSLTFWNAQADLAEKEIKKGSFVSVEGRLQTNSYEKNGTQKYATNIVVSQMSVTPAETAVDITANTGK